ncbi:MAG: hypothetical protein JW750_01850 [Anaerolineaceae bacterium]|nr:hypothetical protein [Anaerolineaceae bacterium]
MSITETFNGLLLLLAALIPFFLLRKALTQTLLVLIRDLTRSPLVAHKAHFVLVLPGVIIHEGSHYLALRLMGVPCTFHLGTEFYQDTVVYGHVDFREADVGPIRHFITGTAPLLVGGLLAALISLYPLHFDQLIPLARADQFHAAIPLFLEWIRDPIWWLWFYLLFTITSEMVPSESDRRYWLPLILIIAVLILIAVLTKTIGWVMFNLYPILDQFFLYCAIIFFLCAIPNLILLLPFGLLRLLFRRR